jgi:D-alanyl-D-alanine endopeptidase (penicillin-binding protein 7)
MQARVAGRQLVIVFLDSAKKSGRIADAERVRQWLEQPTEQTAPQTQPTLEPAQVDVLHLGGPQRRNINPV